MIVNMRYDFKFNILANVAWRPSKNRSPRLRKNLARQSFSNAAQRRRLHTHEGSNVVLRNALGQILVFRQELLIALFAGLHVDRQQLVHHHMEAVFYDQATQVIAIGCMVENVVQLLVIDEDRKSVV